MKNEFYSWAWQYGNQVFLRGMRDGKRFTEKRTFKPTLYVRADGASPYKGLYGENIKPIQFGNNRDAKEFLDSYSQVQNYPILQVLLI